MCERLVEGNMYELKGSAYILGFHLKRINLSNMGTKEIVKPVHISMLINESIVGDIKSTVLTLYI